MREKASKLKESWIFNFGKIKRELIMPQLKLKGTRIGELCNIDISYVENDIQYKKRLDILMMFQKGLICLLMNYKKSKYFEHQIKNKGRSHKQALKKIIKYYLLFKSMKANGIISNSNDPYSFPWLFAALEFSNRLDGHHRTSVARFLGYKQIPVLLITPKDILALPNLSKDLVDFVGKLKEPEIPNMTAYAVEQNAEEITKIRMEKLLHVV